MYELGMGLAGTLEKEGFCIIKNFFSTEAVPSILSNIKNNIALSSLDIEVPIADYLSSTGRWGDKSKITRDISGALNGTIQDKLQHLLQNSILLKKSNVICKTATIVDAVPFHQDISYSFDQPYHFSVWIALNDITNTSGALQIVKKSHTLPIRSAVDFWSPYFIDEYSDKLKNNQIITLPVSVGDAIIFSSRLWHGSTTNLDEKDRFAYVTRWIIKNKNFPIIPKPKPLVFGMFDCGILTEQILRNASLFLHTQSQNSIYRYTTEELIKIWLEHFSHGFTIDGIDTSQAMHDLSRLLILHRATILHDAGDIAGKIYKNLWFSLLKTLNTKVNIVKDEPGNE